MVLSQPPPPSSRPPMTRYKLAYNFTGGVMEYQTTDTNFTVENLTEAGVYMFTVLAVNFLGDGAETSKLLTITGLITPFISTVCYFMIKLHI